MRRVTQVLTSALIAVCTFMPLVQQEDLTTASV